ncbi:hypothetical protein C5167_049165 [Papaver somniferum]|uniref:Uncharacterized protein n=1 Tax=Papaver somniferum TaxID=3469 RepID=A0A4Y7KNL2_PAPSO|nr:hypothetical protein C5167_049165 [Papaver somniferum]
MFQVCLMVSPCRRVHRIKRLVILEPGFVSLSGILSFYSEDMYQEKICYPANKHISLRGHENGSRLLSRYT